MENRVAVISVIVEENGDTNELNNLLHEYGQYIVGRMGIPYRNRKINIFLWKRTPSCLLPSVTFSPSHMKSGT